MGKTRGTALVVAVAIIAVAAMRTATASHDSSHIVFTGGATFKGVVVKTERSGTNVTALAANYQTLDSRGFDLPAGQSQLVVVDLDARTFCDGSGGCGARVRVGRTLATAMAAEPSGNIFLLEAPSNSETRSMSWALCVRNPTASTINLNVFLQVARLNAGVTSFAIGPYTFKIARNSPCSPAVNI